MSSSCLIFYEAADNNHIGTRVHFDGYPDNIIPILNEMTYEEVREIIARGVHEGGLRYIDLEEGYESYAKYNSWPSTCLFTKLSCHSEAWAYLKRRDETVVEMQWRRDE